LAGDVHCLSDSRFWRKVCLPSSLCRWLSPRLFGMGMASNPSFAPLLMSPSSQLQVFLTSFLTQIPTLVVCAVAFIMLLARGKESCPGRSWALLGFGLALGLSVVVPLVQNAVQFSSHPGGDLVSRAWVFTGLSLFWSLVRAVSYACLLAGLLTRRAVPPVPMHPYVE
jgi:hypothetical protein